MRNLNMQWKLTHHNPIIDSDHKILLKIQLWILWLVRVILKPVQFWNKNLLLIMVPIVDRVYLMSDIVVIIWSIHS